MDQSYRRKSDEVSEEGINEKAGAILPLFLCVKATPGRGAGKAIRSDYPAPAL